MFRKVHNFVNLLIKDQWLNHPVCAYFNHYNDSNWQDFSGLGSLADKHTKATWIVFSSRSEIVRPFLQLELPEAASWKMWF